MSQTNASEFAVPAAVPPLRTLQQWLNQGEILYGLLIKECQALEAQIGELENRLAAKQAEVNQVAPVIGKPLIEANRRLSAQLVTHYAADTARNPGQVARVMPSGPTSRPPVDIAAVREHREMLSPKT